jgi:hypothetical protein
VDGVEEVQTLFGLEAGVGLQTLPGLGGAGGVGLQTLPELAVGGCGAGGLNGIGTTGGIGTAAVPGDDGPTGAGAAGLSGGGPRPAIGVAACSCGGGPSPAVGAAACSCGGGPSAAIFAASASGGGPRPDCAVCTSQKVPAPQVVAVHKFAALFVGAVTAGGISAGALATVVGAGTTDGVSAGLVGFATVAGSAGWGGVMAAIGLGSSPEHRKEGAGINPQTQQQPPSGRAIISTAKFRKVFISLPLSMVTEGNLHHFTRAASSAHG